MVARHTVRRLPRRRPVSLPTRGCGCWRKPTTTIRSSRSRSCSRPPIIRSAIRSISRPIRNADGIVGCALAAAPDGLEITEMPDDGVPLVVASIAHVRPDLSSVSGPRDSALHLRARGSSDAAARGLRHNWMLFRLDELVAPRPASGYLRLAQEDDWPWLSRCAPGYARETDTPFDVAAFLSASLAAPRAVRLGARRTEKRRGRVRQDREQRADIRGLHARGPRARLCEQRGRGRKSDGSRCGSGVLHAGAEREPAQPARIYRALGFKPIRDHLVIDLLR